MEKHNIQNSQVLIITSMHRSGSSLTASLLQSAGLHIGRRLMGAAEANIKGHFENLDFWSLHQKVLKSQGANEEGWTLQDQIQVDDYYREEAKNIVTKNAISGLWGWKDPRTTLFLEFWANLLPEANFLLLFRYPWEVVSSLYRKGQPYAIFQEQPELAIKFWLHYNQKILNFSNSFPQRCFLVSLNNFLQHTQPFIDALNQKFRINLSIPNPTIYQPSLLHRQNSEGHRASLINHYYPEAIALYQELEARAWQLTDAPDTSWQEKLKSSPYRIWAFQDWVKVGNLQGENQKLQQELGQTKSQLHQTQAELGQTQSQLHQTQAELGQTQSQLHQTQEELGQTQSQLHQTQEELGQTQSQLHQTQEELGQTQSQLHQTQEELGQTQSQLEERQTQLYQTEAMLSQYQSHLQQVETLLEQSQTQLHQKTEELEKTQGQLHQTQEELGQTQSQLHQTQAELGQTQSQLHQTQAELGQTQSQLHETEEKLGQTQSQLHQTEEVLEQSQAQLHETEAVLEQSVTQLQQKTQELQQSQSQLHQVQEELERSQSQQQQIKQEEQQAKSELAQTRSKLEEVQTQLYQTEAMLTEYQSHRQQTESALERSLSQLQETRSELERYKTEFERSRLEETLASAAENDEQMQYNLLLWDGWQAYRNGDMNKMAHCLQQSLKFTSLSRTETILNWLENFSRFSSENGYQLDIQELTNLAEWQQLVRRLTAAKSLIAIK
ncbi:chromosome partitioning protein ParA [Planktothricoides raciborskii]|uniref:Chromosome partitioning protein ParA n=1 Tax=Planktothricoides raciborskii GIHE-MW2 TaxID=2792601 RepID=A0AAU8JCG8_9CYAN